MARIYTILIDNQPIEVSEADNIGLRLDRLVQSATNFGSKGGDTSLSFNIPRTKNNNRVIGVNYELGGINKFNRLTFYEADILLDGSSIFKGTFRLKEINSRYYVGEFVGQNIDWINALNDFNLNEIGYVDGEPTWTAPFLGGSTINAINKLSNEDTDIVCPTICYTNTIITDYDDFRSIDVYGQYDGTGAQIATGLSFPDEFDAKHAWFGNRIGLTFEDFPPAVYYSNLIRKVFDELGYNVAGQIFEEEWFNKLIMPYVGEGYKYNWATLAHLHTEQDQVTETGLYENRYLVETGVTMGDFHVPNIAIHEDYPARVDYVANFSKQLVSDSYAGTIKGGGYVVPTTGKYKIRVKGYYKKFMEPLDTIASNLLDVLGLLDPNRGWDDNVLVITRRDENGDLVFNYKDPTVAMPPNPQDWRWFVAEWMNFDNSRLTTYASDVIAYISPKRYNLLGNDIEALGTPLNNWTSTINVINSTHTIISDTVTDKTSETEVEFEVEMFLQKNERINFYWQAHQFDKDYSLLVTDSYSITNDSDSLIEIEYLCGTEELDIAGNLPAISAKQFVSSFINQFNLFFDVNDESNTVTFYFNDQYFEDYRDSYVIDDVVDVDTLVLKPLTIPKNVLIGYDNDDNDRQLSYTDEGCVTSSTEVSQYGNVVLQGNDNAYGTSDIDLKTIFSATRFDTGTFIYTDTDGATFGTATITNVQTPPNYPVDSLIYTSSIQATEEQAPVLYDVPTIQSIEQYEAIKFKDVRYQYNYKPRLLYHLGTSETYLNLDADWKIRINAPDVIAMFDADTHWIQTTVHAFDTENNNPYPTLRYDTENGIYAQYFEDLLTNSNESYMLECDAWLRPIDWIRMKGSTIIKYRDNLYRLVNISEFDPLGRVPSKITLLKLI